MIFLICIGLSLAFAGYVYSSRPHDQPALTPLSAYTEAKFTSPNAGDANNLYLDLLRRAVTNIIYQELSFPLWVYGNDRRARLCKKFNLIDRVNGEDMPANSFSMIGVRRLESLQECVETVLRENVPGDLVEAGACKGGACIFMKGVLKVHDDTDRKIFVCDTFIPQPKRSSELVQILFVPVLGLVSLLAMIPIPAFRKGLFKVLSKANESFPTCEENYGEDEISVTMFILKNMLYFRPSYLDTALDNVKSYFARFGLLDDNVVFLKGFFADTIPKADDLNDCSLIRLDGDTYESTIDALNNLYPKLTSGGFCIIDDYNAFDSCKMAVEEYRKEHNITEEIVPIDNLAVYWRRA